MKKILLALFLLMEFYSNAQIVNIPDINFKQALISYSDIVGRRIDTNNDGEIQYAEAVAFSQGGYILEVNNKNISDLTGIQAFTSLGTLYCSGNNLSSLDISNMSISELDCHNNNLTMINLAGCGDFLYSANLNNNQLSFIDLSGLNTLETLSLSYNNFISLDVSNAPALRYLSCAHNQLSSLNVKNGLAFNYTGYSSPFEASGNPGLQYVCADTAEVLYLINYFVQNGMNSVQVDASCNFSTSAGYGSLTGVAKMDLDNNGCDAADNGKSLLPLKLINDNDTAQNFFLKADSSGNYSVNTYAGNYSLTPQFQIPYYNITPDTIHFSGIPGTTQNINFCIAANGSHNDLDIKINYIFLSSPDGIAHALITYKNKGTEALSGDVQFLYDDAKMDYLNATPAISSQSTGLLTWAISNLQPFESRTIEALLYILPPPVNNFEDTFTFTAIINPAVLDETPADNSYIFSGRIGILILPISMEYLKGAIQAGKNLLNWKINCTSNQVILGIERSIDARKFNSLQNITASNTRCLQPFDFIDNNPASGINYYRIKMTDVDGKFSYSNTIALLNSKNGFEIVNLTPNPVTAGTALLNIASAEKQVVNINVIDAAGKLVQSTGQPVIAGFTQVNMNLNNLPAGIYTISLYTSKGERKTMQFVKN